MYLHIYIRKYVRVYMHVHANIFFLNLQHVTLQVVILHAWKDLRTRFTLYKFPSYFRLINMADCVLFFLT